MPDFSLDSAPCALAIFCRAPRLGTVKTRLAARHGDEFALELYRAMLADSFSLGRSLAPQVDTFACFTPDDAFEDGPLAALWDGPALAQCSGDLGVRMLDCLARLRAMGYQRIVLIGSDSPDMPAGFARMAFEKLGERALVIGPSADGGFYLIGASVEVRDAIFRGIIWSSEEVYGKLIENLGQLSPQLTVATLPAWRDVDDESDLRALERRWREGDSDAPKTRAFIEGHGNPAPRECPSFGHSGLGCETSGERMDGRADSHDWRKRAP